MSATKPQTGKKQQGQAQEPAFAMQDGKLVIGDEEDGKGEGATTTFEQMSLGTNWNPSFLSCGVCK